MRKVTAALVALTLSMSAAMLATTASAADDEGKIANVDREALTITLENGNTYKLSNEFDMEALAEGMEVVLAYDTIGGEKLVTDMVTYE